MSIIRPAQPDITVVTAKDTRGSTSDDVSVAMPSLSENDESLILTTPLNRNYTRRQRHDSTVLSSADERDDFMYARDDELLMMDTVVEGELSPVEADMSPSVITRNMPDGVVFVILRFPLLIVIGCVLLFDLCVYILIRQWVRFQESITGPALSHSSAKQRSQIISALDNAIEYDQWRTLALQLDKVMRRNAWKQQNECAFYDFRLIKRCTRMMSLLRKESTNADGTLKLTRLMLDAALKSNLGGIENVALYSRTYHGTKVAVEDYVDEVEDCLQFVNDCLHLSAVDKYKFYKTACKTYGMSALCLSGGATLSYYHVGVVHALLQNDRLPQLITGTSGGAMIAAFVCCRNDEELRKELTPDLCKYFTALDCTWREMFSSFRKTGAVFDIQHWAEKLVYLTRGDTTFLEAYERNGRILNITVVSTQEHSPAKLLNYKTSPDVVIGSAVLASSAIPGVLPAVELKRKLADGSIVPYVDEGNLWRDGSLRIDIPIEQLHKMFRVNYTMVSQVNPHVILFFYEAKGSSGRPTYHRQGTGWRGGFIAASLERALKLDLKKWLLIIRDLQLLPMFFSQDWSNVFLQKFEGSITIVPRPSLTDYVHLLNDPTEARMKRYIEKGAVNTFPKLHMIGNRMRIEHALQRSRDRWREQLGKKKKDS